jgi:hypothetical protein
MFNKYGTCKLPSPPNVRPSPQGYVETLGAAVRDGSSRYMDQVSNAFNQYGQVTSLRLAR